MKPRKTDPYINKVRVKGRASTLQRIKMKKEQRQRIEHNISAISAGHKKSVLSVISV